MLRVSAIALLFITFNVSAEIKIIELGQGWSAIAEQSDPFDKSKLKITQLYKGSFYVDCDSLSMRTGEDFYFKGFRYKRTVKFKVDGKNAVTKDGWYSTYRGGSSIVNNERYYSIKLTNSDIAAFKKGNAVKVAGKESSSSWTTKTLNLMGFTKAYNRMCK